MTIEEEIRKETARIARLKVERDKGYAIAAVRLLVQAIELVEHMDPDPGLTEVAGLLCMASDTLCKWEPIPHVPVRRGIPHTEGPF